MRILMISSTFPYPPSRGGTEIRTFNLLRHLHVHHEVTVITQRHEGVSDDDVRVLQDHAAAVEVFDLAPSPPSSSLFSPINKIQRFVSSVAAGLPPNVQYRYSPAMQEWIDGAIANQSFDAITCEHSVNAVYIRPEYQRSTQTVLNAHSLIYNWMINHLDMNASDNAARDRLYLSTVRRYEKRYAQQFSKVVVTTTDDQQALTDICPDLHSLVIPNGVDLEMFPYRPADPGGYELVFVGAMDSSHNIDAARFFVTEVMPTLRKKYPEVVFTIVGARPNETVQALTHHPGVTVTGKVDSIADYLHRACVCVVPLRAGFGIKNKTLEAMAAGVPVVGSDRGLEGLSVDSDSVPLRALRANQPDEYISAISQLFESPSLRAKLSKHGRDHVEDTYTWEQAGRAYEAALAS